MTESETRRALWEQQTQETRRLWKNSWYIGAVIVLMLALDPLSAWLIRAPLLDAQAHMYDSSLARIWFYAFYDLEYLAAIALPAILAALFFRIRPLPDKGLRRRISLPSAAALTAFGLAFCILANFIVNYWLTVVSQFGIEPFLGSYNNDPGWLPLTLNLITYALLPGIFEELVFRGYLLNALRPFGERRALILSALIFGLMHENLTQAPFAFLLGLLFGFLALRTGHLWVGMILHFLNNSMSVVLDYVAKNAGLSESDAILMQYSLFLILGILGGAALLWLHAAEESSGYTLLRPLTDRRSVLTSAKRARLMWLTPGTLVAVISLIVMTVIREVQR